MVQKLALVRVRLSWAEKESADVALDYVVVTRSVNTAVWLSRVKLCSALDAKNPTRILVIGEAVIF
jgi:hypothetical protein